MPEYWRRTCSYYPLEISFESFWKVFPHTQLSERLSTFHSGPLIRKFSAIVNMNMLVYFLIQNVHIQLTLNDILSSIIEICISIRYNSNKCTLENKKCFYASMFLLQMELHDRPIYFLILLATRKIRISGKCLTFVIF